MTIARMACTLAMVATMAGCETYTGRLEVADAAVANVLRLQIGGEKSQTAPTVAGSMLGAYAGTEVGRKLDSADRRYAEEDALKSLETAPARQTSRWSNPDNRHAGTFTPFDLYRSADGLFCRDFDMSATVDERTQNAYGTACRSDAGEWRIVETPVRRAIPRDASRRIP